MSNTILQMLVLVVGGELIIHLLFYLISRSIGKQSKDRLSMSTILKGLLERFYVVSVLFLDMGSALTLLGALKIATRIKDEENRVSNDFFFIGNIVSILFGIGYYIILKLLIVLI